MRAALARLLLQAPSLLLLDEPTNHLDLESLGWLEDFLADYAGTVVVVSHDRYFLNRMVTSIAELSAAGLSVYEGDYDDYLVERDARHALLEARARNQAKRIEEIERFIERFRYQATKARQVQSRIKMLERVERIEVPAAARQIHFKFPEPPRTGRRVAALSGVHKSYGDNVVYAGVDFAVERGQRVALVGENGAGKSTLLKILAGVLPFEHGARTLGANVVVHYYAQHQVDALDPERTALAELAAAAPDAGQTRLRAVLGAFLFSGDSVEKKVAVLSGGEKARLALAKMLVRPAALLCLDEPTNHLDLASREVLEAALATFAGTIVFISHDRYFINRIATEVTHVHHGRLTRYLGGYDDYVRGLSTGVSDDGAPQARRGADVGLTSPPTASPASGRFEHATRPASAPSVPPASGPRRVGPASVPVGDTVAAPVARIVRRKSTVELRELRKRIEDVERKIDGLERRIEEIGRALSDPRLYANGDRVRAITLERNDAVQQLSGLMREWEQLSTGLAGHD
jgi:ATP-binding cassette subfamily F protein 3